ncbi:MAG: hypothetical protein ACK5HP_03830 [Bacilli bacterium]
MNRKIVEDLKLKSVQKNLIILVFVIIILTVGIIIQNERKKLFQAERSELILKLSMNNSLYEQYSKTDFPTSNDLSEILPMGSDVTNFIKDEILDLFAQYNAKILDFSFDEISVEDTNLDATMFKKLDVHGNRFSGTLLVDSIDSFIILFQNYQKSTRFIYLESIDAKESTMYADKIEVVIGFVVFHNNNIDYTLYE